MSDYKNPRPLSSASASDPCVVYDNSVSFDKLINESEVVTTYKGVGLQSIPRLLEQIEAEANAAVISLGWHQVGLFADGFTYTLQNDIAKDSLGDWYRWNGTLPKVVIAGTLPSSDANFVKIDYKSHAELSDRNPANGSAHNADDIGNNEGGTVQDFIDAQVATVTELATGKYLVGQIVTLTDRKNGKFEVVSGGVPNGKWILDAGNGNTAVLRTFFTTVGIEVEWLGGDHQAALEYAATIPLTGGRLPVVFTGVYNRTTPIIWPTSGDTLEDIALIGDYVTNTRSNATSQINMLTGGTCIDLRKGIDANTTGGVRIEGFSMLGLAGYTAIRGWNVVSSQFKNLAFGGFDIGMDLESWSYYCVFEDCNFFGVRKRGIKLNIFNGTWLVRCRFNKIDPLGSVSGDGACIEITSGGSGGGAIECWFEDTRKLIIASNTDDFKIKNSYIEGIVYPINAGPGNVLSDIDVIYCVQTMWHDNTRLYVNENNGTIVGRVRNHKTLGDAGLANVSVGLRSGAGKIYLDFTGYNQIAGTPFQFFGYEPLVAAFPNFHTIYNTGAAVAVGGNDVVEYGANNINTKVKETQSNIAALAKRVNWVKSVALTNAVDGTIFTFTLPLDVPNSRLIGAIMDVTIGTGRASRVGRYAINMQTQAGGATVRANITELSLTPSLNESTAARTIASVVPSVVITGTTVEVKLNVTSGGTSAPFNSSAYASIEITDASSNYTFS